MLGLEGLDISGIRIDIRHLIDVWFQVSDIVRVFIRSSPCIYATVHILQFKKYILANIYISNGIIINLLLINY